MIKGFDKARSDPRAEFKSARLTDDVEKVSDVKEGMIHEYKVTTMT